MHLPLTVGGCAGQNGLVAASKQEVAMVVVVMQALVGLGLTEHILFHWHYIEGVVDTMHNPSAEAVQTDSLCWHQPEEQKRSVVLPGIFHNTRIHSHVCLSIYFCDLRHRIIIVPDPSWILSAITRWFCSVWATTSWLNCGLCHMLSERYS